MANVKELVVKLIADASGYDKGTKKAVKDNEDIKKSSGGLKDGFVKGAGAALGFIGTAVGISSVGDAIGMVKDYMTEAVQSAMDMQTAQAETNRILASGNHVMGLTGAAVDDISQRMMAQTGVDDDVVRGAENILAGYNNISLKAFPGVTAAALDMARAQQQATGQQFDAAAASRALGMALQDPAKGARLLRQYNIVLSQSQQDAINTAMKHGEVQKAQGIIMDAVTAKVNGASAAYKNTAAGGMMAFQTAMGNIQKAIGSALLPVLTKILNIAVPIATQFAQQLPAALDAVGQSIGPIVKGFGDLIGNLTKNKPLMDGIKNAFKELQPFIGPVVAGLAILTALTFAPLILLIGVILGIVLVLKKLWEITEPVRTALGNLFGAIGEGIQKAQAVFRQGVENILEMLSHIPGPAGDMARGVLNNMKAADDATKAHTEAMKAEASANTAAMAEKSIANLEKQRQGILKQLAETKDPAKKHMLELQLNTVTATENMQKGVLKHAQEMTAGHVAKMQELKNKSSAEAKAAKDSIVGRMGEMKDQALGHIGDFIGGAVKFFQSLPGKVGDFLGMVLGKIGGFIGDAVANFLSLPGKVGHAIDLVKNAVQNKINDVKGIFQRGLDAINGFFKNLKLAFPNIKMPHFSITGSFNLNPPSVPHLDIQWYKTGGIFNGPQVIGVGEAGPEAVIPLDRLSSAGGGSGGGNGSGQPTLIQLDGRTIVRAFLPYLVEELRRSGAIRSI